MPNPFGLAGGITPAGTMATYFVEFRSVPNPHPDFKNYTGNWTPERGLEALSADSEVFDDPAGLLVQTLYSKIKRQLTSIYGQGVSVEEIKTRAMWDDGDFVRSLAEEERDHFTIWDKGDGSALDDGIYFIHLSLSANNECDAYVNISYHFYGSDKQENDDVGMSSL